jgi:hypothetical protein
MIEFASSMWGGFGASGGVTSLRLGTCDAVLGALFASAINKTTSDRWSFERPICRWVLKDGVRLSRGICAKFGSSSLVGKHMASSLSGRVCVKISSDEVDLWPLFIGVILVLIFPLPEVL